MTIGEKIGYFAKLKGMTLRRLASECGISYSTLQSSVSRKSNRISDDNLQKISLVLGIPVEQFKNELKLEHETASILSDAETKLNATISSIIGFSTGDERDDKLYLINSFLETNSGLIRDIFSALTREKGEDK